MIEPDEIPRDDRVLIIIYYSLVEILIMMNGDRCGYTIHTNIVITIRTALWTSDATAISAKRSPSC